MEAAENDTEDLIFLQQFQRLVFAVGRQSMLNASLHNFMKTKNQSYSSQGSPHVCFLWYKTMEYAGTELFVTDKL